MTKTRIDGMLTSRRQDWGTPPAFLDYLRTERTWVPDLDAAASHENTKAPAFFDGDHFDSDGLEQDWFGDVWLNPPFGNEIGSWLAKCAEEIKRPEVNSIMALVPARCDTKWFHEIVMPHAYMIFLIKGRFNFRFDDATPSANAPFPSMLILYRKHKFPDAGITILNVPKEARGFL